MLEEVFRRAKVIQQKETRRQTRLLGIIACGLLFALFVVIGSFSGGASVQATTLGAFLLGPEAGGYVIVALIAFTLGLVVAALCARWRKGKASE